MTIYSIYEKSPAKGGNIVAPAAIPERFSWFAMLLTPIYALAHGLWLLLLFWLVLIFALYAVGRVIGTDATFAIYCLVAVFLGFEAPAFRRDSLALRGWQYRGEVIAPREDRAQTEYLSHRK
jgi:hypothetical protein